jgi:hypothetical protein
MTGRVLTSVLVIALIGTNAFWIWILESEGFFNPGRGWDIEQRRNQAFAAQGAIALIPLMATGHASKTQILDTLLQTNPTWQVRETNHVFRVGGLDLEFTPEDTLLDIRLHVDMCC